MTYEEEQALLTQNSEMKKQLETLTTTLKALTQPEPAKVRWDSANSLEVDPALVNSGKIVIEPPPEEEERPLKANEIRRSDQRRISAHVQELASGTMVLVD